ncbi:glycosyltransferase family 39 protein [Pararobbsia silviterrae]|uniref:Glycosyltransferase family 39 protein n=1 Tax=Pararobbsia silviterrae TaxID=1792498 RepID=A0A494XXZ0_9BURK|nr:glycosyltransferase family 39 protein [Pararobbsia silviterrae]RKP54795.1 glycosyltransferase family 39 protein [Pararobbsia silviterrae]
MFDTTERQFLSRGALFLLLVAFAVLWFAPLDYRHLVPSDEGRYAEMAREMFVTHDWITPRYNGLKYFEKPPLQTWANALTYAMFGIGAWQARLYTALTGFVGILVLGFTGTRVFNRSVGFFAALALAASPYWFSMGHFDTLDMGLSFWMQVTLCTLLLAQRAHLAPWKQRFWMWACWASMALAVLSKGLVGVILPGAVLVLYTLIARDWALWKRLYLGSGLVIFFAISVPWFVLVEQRNPGFLNFFFIVQQFERYLTPAQNRPGPIYYFVPVLLIGFLPWLSLTGQSVRYAVRLQRQNNGFSPVLLLLVWAAFIFLFFSVSHSKLLSYVLPVAPAIALLIGLYLPHVERPQLHRHFVAYAVLLVVGCFGALALLRAGDARTPNALYRAYLIWVYAALVVGLLAIGLALVRLRASRTGATGPALVIFAAAWVLLISIAGNGYEVFAVQRSGAQLAPAIRAALAKLPADTPFYAVRGLDHTIPFYAGHTTIMVESADELAYGVSVEPQKWVPTVDAWKQRWNADHAALALMSPETYTELAKDGVPMTVIARDSRRVVVEKPNS